jgi:hypothetical protein
MDTQAQGNPQLTEQQIRLEIERLRLETERYRVFLHRWEADVRPIHEIQERSREMSHAYSKMGIQTMFWLNGGAVVAFPTFAKLADVKFAEHATPALFSVGAFVVGLVCIAITTVCAFFAMDSDTQAIRNWSEVIKSNLNKELDPKNTKADWDARRDAAEKAQAAHGRAERCWRNVAVGFAFGSCGAFIGGLYWPRSFSGLLLMPSGGSPVEE